MKSYHFACIWIHFAGGTIHRELCEVAGQNMCVRDSRSETNPMSNEKKLVEEGADQLISSFNTSFLGYRTHEVLHAISSGVSVL